MARKVQVILTDDVDGSEAAETVNFGLDGVTYEIDLSDHPHWKGAVNEVWFDPGECFNADVSIVHLGFSPKPSK